LQFDFEPEPWIIVFINKYIQLFFLFLHPKCEAVFLGFHFVIDENNLEPQNKYYDE